MNYLLEFNSFSAELLTNQEKPYYLSEKHICIEVEIPQFIDGKYLYVLPEQEQEVTDCLLEKNFKIIPFMGMRRKNYNICISKSNVVYRDYVTNIAGDCSLIGDKILDLDFLKAVVAINPVEYSEVHGITHNGHSVHVSSIDDRSIFARIEKDKIQVENLPATILVGMRRGRFITFDDAINYFGNPTKIKETTFHSLKVKEWKTQEYVDGTEYYAIVSHREIESLLMSSNEFV